MAPLSFKAGSRASTTPLPHSRPGRRTLSISASAPDAATPLSTGTQLNGGFVKPILDAPAYIPVTAPRAAMSPFSQSQGRLRIFSGTSNPQLSQEVAHYLGLNLGGIKIKRFADGEVYVQVQESIRGCDVYLVQPTCPPANDHLMELLIMVDACKRASARSITAVIPYFGYARADRKTQGRESIAAKLVANIITESGADRVLCVDLHSGQCVGYFDIPVDHVYGMTVILDYLASKRIPTGELVVVSPDVGGVARARAFAKKLNDAPLAIVDKRRSAHNVSEVMNLIGDVRGKIAVLVDDMIDTAGTITNAAKVLHEQGAKEVYACATHAVFSPPAVERLSSGVFQEVIVTNTIPIKDEQMFPQLTVLSVANLLGETIWRVHNASSVQGNAGFIPNSSMIDPYRTSQFYSETSPFLHGGSASPSSSSSPGLGLNQSMYACDVDFPRVVEQEVSFGTEADLFGPSSQEAMLGAGGGAVSFVPASSRRGGKERRNASSDNLSTEQQEMAALMAEMEATSGLGGGGGGGEDYLAMYNTPVPTTSPSPPPSPSSPPPRATKKKGPSVSPRIVSQSPYSGYFEDGISSTRDEELSSNAAPSSSDQADPTSAVRPARASRPYSGYFEDGIEGARDEMLLYEEKYNDESGDEETKRGKKNAPRPPRTVIMPPSWSNPPPPPPSSPTYVAAMEDVRVTSSPPSFAPRTTSEDKEPAESSQLAPVDGRHSPLWLREAQLITHPALRDFSIAPGANDSPPSSSSSSSSSSTSSLSRPAPMVHYGRFMHWGVLAGSRRMAEEKWAEAMYWNALMSSIPRGMDPEDDEAMNKLTG